MPKRANKLLLISEQDKLWGCVRREERGRGIESNPTSMEILAPHLSIAPRERGGLPKTLISYHVTV